MIKTKGGVYWPSLQKKEGSNDGDKKEEKKDKKEKFSTTTNTWWQKEQWHVISAGVAYALFWFCLYWYFPTSGEISTDRLMLLGGLIALVIIGLASPKWSALIICSLLLVMVAIGMISRLGNGGYLPKPSLEAVVSAPMQTPSAPPTTSASVTVSRKDGWVPIRVKMSIGKTWTAKTTPQTAVVSVRRPDGKIHKSGYGHEYDICPSEQRNAQEWQVWFVATNKNTPVTYTVTWAN